MDDTYLDRQVLMCRHAIAEACGQVGRNPFEVTLMAAIKSADVEEINHIHRVCGVSCVGENRVQQLLSRYDALDKEGLKIHFIGTLQTNKVKYIIDKVDMIQSLDSLRLADEIEKQAAKVNKTMEVLVEINAGREEAKSGVMPEEAETLAKAVTGGGYPHLALKGFMTMAPRCEDEAAYRSYFSDIRILSHGIWQRLGRDPREMVLSMGMSESYIPAVMEGATLVRVGRSLFQKPCDASAGQ